MAMKVLAVLLANFINGADVGMIQCGAARASRRKRSRACGSRATSSGRNFSATMRPRSSVFGLVNHTHATPTDLFHDPIVGDGLADHEK